MTKRAEIVVAQYREDTTWTDNISNATITIYNKGGTDNKGGIALPNYGREAHTYLHHIIKQYDNIAPVTIFTQGTPFDHCPNFVNVAQLIADNVDGASAVPFRNLSNWTLTIDNLKCACWPYHQFPNRLPEVAHALFGDDFNEQIWFGAGAIFMATQQAIHKHPRNFYEQAQSFFKYNPDNPCCLGYSHAF
jgi:hypothetical protein